MIFYTFLNRFELRTGCFVVAVLHMAFIILSLHMPLLTNFIGNPFSFVMAVEKFIEMSTTVMLIYAAFNKNRNLLLVWQSIVPFNFLFNFSYFIYQSYMLNDLWLLTVWVMSMDLVTYSLMLINSFYDELGYLEIHRQEMSNLREQQFQLPQRDRGARSTTSY
ncbi:hypothetical protein KR222_010693 [Zaprionus bogoriensis]|nr:hypothetical protein KR222_010693 [Zaprionus bogoriensis]